jgi:hypothetical protein
MVRKLGLIFAALAVVAAACGGGADANSCEGVADEAIGLFQGLIDEIDGMSAADLGNATELPALTELESDMEALGEKSEQLGCSDAEMEELFQDRVGTLTAKTAFGEVMLEGFKEGAEGGF